MSASTSGQDRQMVGGWAVPPGSHKEIQFEFVVVVEWCQSVNWFRSLSELGQPQPKILCDHVITFQPMTSQRFMRHVVDVFVWSSSVAGACLIHKHITMSQLGTTTTVLCEPKNMMIPRQLLVVTTWACKVQNSDCACSLVITGYFSMLTPALTSLLKKIS